MGIKGYNHKIAVFRCDSSSSMGGGHVMRCLTLADALSENGWKCIFASSQETLETSIALKQSSYDLCQPHELGGLADILIVDHYGLDISFERECRSWAKKILVIDDLADRQHDCDILLDQTYARDKADYSGLAPEECKFLTGVEYALLRPQFVGMREQSLQRESRKGALKRLFIFMSTLDHKQVTNKILAALNEITVNLTVDVVLADKSKNFESVKELTNISKHNIKLHAHVSNMAALMASADLAIGAGGTTSWERCCLGLPACVIELADNQKTIMKNLEAAGAIINLGKAENLSQSTIASIIESLINKPEKVLSMSQKSAQICDGLGVQRTLDEIENA